MLESKWKGRREEGKVIIKDNSRRSTVRVAHFKKGVVERRANEKVK